MLPSSNVSSNLCSISKINSDIGPRRALTEDERWYAVYTQPNREVRAQLHLEFQGFQTFLPRYSKTIRHARQIRTIFAPLFSRYLFITLDVNRDRWRSVNGTFGVSSLVMQNSAPAAVAKGFVESLLDAADEDSVIEFPTMKPGQSVRVMSGPFADQLGVLDRLSSADRVRVLLSIMNSRVPVDLDMRSIAPL